MDAMRAQRNPLTHLPRLTERRKKKDRNSEGEGETCLEAKSRKGLEVKRIRGMNKKEEAVRER